MPKSRRVFFFVQIFSSFFFFTGWPTYWRGKFLKDCLRLSVRARNVFIKSTILRCGSVQFKEIGNLTVRFGAVIYLTVRFGAAWRNGKSYGAALCGFQKS